MPAHASSDPDRDADLRDYLQQLEHGLGLVAAYTRHEPELSLWCCRRVGELVLRCLHVHFCVDSPQTQHASFQELLSLPLPGLKLKDVVGLANYQHLTNIQRLGNLGVHPRRRGREEALDSVLSACHALPPLIGGLFDERALGPVWRSEEIDRHLHVISRGGREQPPDLQVIEALEGVLRDREDRLQTLESRLAAAESVAQAQAEQDVEARLRAAVTATTGRLTAELADARTRIAEGLATQRSLQVELDQARLEAESQRRLKAVELEALQRKLGDQAAALGPMTKERNRFRRKARVRLLVGALTLFAVFRFGTEPGQWWAAARSAIAPEDPLQEALQQLQAQRAHDPAKGTLRAAAAPHEAVKGVDGVADAARAALVPPQCPEGTLQIETTKLRLAPPERPSWPEPRTRRLNPVPVDAFCIDRSPTMGTTDPKPANCLGNPQAFTGPVPTTCVRRSDARAACERRGGVLPTIAHWEAVARSSAIDEVGRDLPREWVEDAFPPAIFAMGHADDPDNDAVFRDKLLRAEDGAHLRWSWNRQPSDRRWTNLGFRCVFSLDE